MTFTKRYYQSAYGKHKYRARKYGIGFSLTFQEWFDWWGEDIDRRGNNADSLCMCRIGDTGDYALDNIYKDTRSNNTRLMIQEGRHGKRLPDELISEVMSYQGKLSTRKVAALTGVSKSKVAKLFKS